MSTNFPVKVRAKRTLAECMLTEGHRVILGRNNVGVYNFEVNFGTSAIAKAAWKSATVPTVTANSYTALTGGSILVPLPGRMFVVTKLCIQTAVAAEVWVKHAEYQIDGLDGQTASPELDGTLAQFPVKTTIDAAGDGESIIDFSSYPMLIKHGESLSVMYTSSSTTGLLGQVTAYGFDVTNDYDYDADYLVTTVGDSISGPAQDGQKAQFKRREDGTIAGLWPFIIKDKLARAGIRARIVNRGISSTTSSYWDNKVNYGQLNIHTDLLILNVGMNDAISDQRLSTVAGTDGMTKQAIKNIIRAYFTANPKGSMIVNNIAPTNETSRNTAVASGMYAGQLRVDAYRLEIAAAVSEMQVKYPTWNLVFAAGTGTMYAKTDYTYFQESGTTSGIHPNMAYGYPAMANVVWTALQTTNFYQNTPKIL